MDTKKLRQKILDLAIHGKLVPPACRQAGKTLTMNPEPPIKGKKCWFTYVIECEDGSFYKGHTDNLLRRYKQHCDGNGAEYTKKHKPKQLYYWEMHYTQENALNREKYLKSGIGREWFKREVIDKPENFEPASVLLERIRAEKERLVKEGKIKKSKTSKTSDTPHYEQTPEGWCITNIGDLLINRDGERKPVSSPIRSKQVNKIYDYYGAAGVIDKVDDYIFDERLLLIGEDGANLLSRSKDNAFFAEGKYWVNNHAHVLDATDKFILDYVAIVINAMKLDDYVTGSAQPKLSQDNLNKIPIYLPPLEEQKRILVEINRLFDLIYKLELGKADLATIVKQAKTKILDLAIHGKLVPQDPSDEPASELLKRINPKAELTSDNGQYGKVPVNWCITCIKNAFLINPRNKAEDVNNAGFVPMTNICDGYFNRFTYETKKWAEIKTGFTHFADGDIAVAKISPCLENRKSMVLKNLPNGIGAGTTELHVFRPLCVIQSFGLWFFKSDYFVNQCVGTFNGVVGQQRVGKNIVEDILFSLPPLAEQHRIVAKIEELFSSLDNIQKSLEV